MNESSLELGLCPKTGEVCPYLSSLERQKQELSMTMDMLQLDRLQYEMKEVDLSTRLDMQSEGHDNTPEPETEDLRKYGEVLFESLHQWEAEAEAACNDYMEALVEHTERIERSCKGGPVEKKRWIIFGEKALRCAWPSAPFKVDAPESQIWLDRQTPLE